MVRLRLVANRAQLSFQWLEVLCMETSGCALRFVKCRDTANSKFLTAEKQLWIPRFGRVPEHTLWSSIPIRSTV